MIKSVVMADTQYYGIKYPFVSQDVENYFVDVNKNVKDFVRSMIFHVIFTPKGQKLRDPEFGTNLIKYIFEPSDNESWESIRSEISDAVGKYIRGANISNIQVMQGENDASEVYVRIDYTVSNPFTTLEDSVVTKL